MAMRFKVTVMDWFTRPSDGAVVSRYRLVTADSEAEAIQFGVQKFFGPNVWFKRNFRSQYHNYGQLYRHNARYGGSSSWGGEIEIDVTNVEE